MTPLPTGYVKLVQRYSAPGYKPANGVEYCLASDVATLEQKRDRLRELVREMGVEMKQQFLRLRAMTDLSNCPDSVQARASAACKIQALLARAAELEKDL